MIAVGDLHTHAVAGRPERGIIKLTADLNVDLLVIGAADHSAFYVRIAGSSAERIKQLAHAFPRRDETRIAFLSTPKLMTRNPHPIR